MKQISPKAKKILIALGLLTVAIVGLTLAYYNSQKEFENEFHVKEPGVAIYEKFNPTDHWVPGEEKSKEIWFKNTGEMDMLLRFSIDVEWETPPIYTNDKGETIVVDVPAKDVVDLYWKNSEKEKGPNGEPKATPLPKTEEEAAALAGFDFIPVTQEGVTYYYYKKVLKAKGTLDGTGADLSKTQNVLESVGFSPNLSNDGHEHSDYSNTQINLTIKGETVLADNEAVKDQWKDMPQIQATIDFATGTVTWTQVSEETP